MKNNEGLGIFSAITRVKLQGFNQSVSKATDDAALFP